MKTTIINQLNIIRLLEHQKLYEKFDLLLNTTKKKATIKVPIELVEHISSRHKETYAEKYYLTSLANYNKLREILLFTISNRQKIKLTLQAMPKDLSKLNYYITLVQNDLKDLILKINASVPEQLSLKPLAPFYFIHHDIKTIKKRISLIVQNHNGAENFKNLFDSFLQCNTYPNYQFIIVDKNSTDNSLEVINSYKDRVNLELMPQDQQYTTAYLNNLAVESCQSEFLLFLHFKAVFQSDILPALYDLFHKDRSTGIIGASISMLQNLSSEETEKYYGRLKFKMVEMVGLPDVPNPVIDPEFLVESGINLTIKGFRNEERTFIPPGYSLTCLRPDLATHDKMTGPEVVPAVPGFAVFCRRDDFIRAGGFDLNFFNGFEFTDLCMQFARNLTKKTLLAHDIEIRLDTDDMVREWGPPDPAIENHNLGTLINRQGYYIKNKYLANLAEGRNDWTDDHSEKVSADSIEEFKNRKFRIAIKIPPLNNENVSLWGDFHFAHSLKDAFIRKGHFARVDLLDSWYENGYMTDDVVVVLRGIKNYHTRGSQINIMWNISHPEHVVWDEYSDYDHVFVASNVFAGELEEKYNIKAEKLLQCTDQGLFYPDQGSSNNTEKTNILYVANSRGVMRKSVEYAIQKNIPVTIYGTNWENILPSDMIGGNFIQNNELRKYYSNCGILLNDHWEDMADKGYISNRIFDALACGAIVLTDRVIGIEQTFPEGLFYYSTADELDEQIQWIEAHYQEAKQLAMKVSDEVLVNHTFDQRAERILEVALQIHDRKTSCASPEITKKYGFFERILDLTRKSH